ncbi:hypothetical protein LTR17_005631 [Elasticomyces elasticus]|nr:hypothetical protein LTR17_005631 [Elasticomyces elasticus]
MGAWGYELFECDDDQDMISDLSSEAGLEDLTKKLLAEKKKETSSQQADSTPSENDKEPEYYELSIHAHHNPDEAAAAAVRDALNAGKLQELVDKYLDKFFATSTKDWYPPEYKVCLIGACAMSLGCTLSPLFKAQLKALYPTTLKMPEARSQMKRALYGPDGYVDGVPYDMPLGLGKIPKRPEPGQGLGGIMSLNVQGQFGLFGAPPNKPEVMAELRQTMKAIREESEGLSSGVCGQCGASEEEGKVLSKCAKCKIRAYCSREHQAAHWPVHKHFCKAPEVISGEETG